MKKTLGARQAPRTCPKMAHARLAAAAASYHIRHRHASANRHSSRFALMPPNSPRVRNNFRWYFALNHHFCRSGTLDHDLFQGLRAEQPCHVLIFALDGAEVHG